MAKRNLPPGEIVKNVQERNGLRYMHVMHRSEIDVAAWLNCLPWYSRNSGEPVQSKRWEDAALRQWHLELSWWPREMIELKGKGGLETRQNTRNTRVMLWWIGHEVKRLRDAIGPACEAFLGYTEEIPQAVYLRNKGTAPMVYTAWDVYEVQIGELGWIPEKFIVLA